MEHCELTGFFSAAQRARLLQATARRFSVRTYTGEADAPQLSALQFAAQKLKLPGVRIVISHCEESKLYKKLPGVTPITGTGLFAAVVVDTEIPHARYHAGICGEAFVLEAFSLGLGACWIGPFKKSGLKIETADFEEVLAVIPFGTFDGEVSPRKRKRLNDICTGNPTDWPLWAYNAAECVRSAPSAMNLQPWHLNFAGRTMLLSKKGLGTQLDLGIALLHMSLGVGEKEHVIRWEEGKHVASLLAEDRLT
ncbi:MAG: hypothetical protein IKM05_06090 [Clostridia bacterium]|nr:hypothetical protein [Clostridia bacterium]